MCPKFVFSLPTTPPMRYYFQHKLTAKENIRLPMNFSNPATTVAKSTA
jgi:hypothetical protein